MNSIEKTKGQTQIVWNDRADIHARYGAKEDRCPGGTAQGNIYVKNEMARELREKGFPVDAIRRILHLDDGK